MPVVAIVLYRKMLSLGATCTLKFDPLFSVKWNNSNHYVGVSIKTACTCIGMWSYVNDAFKFSKTAKNTQHVHHSSRSHGTVFFL